MIRRATLADAVWFTEQARDYLAESGDGFAFDWDHTLARVRGVLGSPYTVAFIAPGRGHILATGIPSLYHPKESICRVSTVWVRPPYRGTGLGVRLIRRLEREIDATSGARILIDSNLRLRDAGEMYERMGYEAVQVLFERQK